MEDSGFIDLYFGDEIHFCLTPNVPYAWQTKDYPIFLPAAKGKFLSVVGLMSHKNNLFFEMPDTTFNTDIFIQLMERYVVQIVKKTAVVLDNCSIHKSKKFNAKIEKRKEKDVFIYFLPPYSMELNLIEIL